MNQQQNEISNGLTRRNDIRGTWSSSASRHRIYGTSMPCVQDETLPPAKSPHSCGCPVPATDPLWGRGETNAERRRRMRRRRRRERRRRGKRRRRFVRMEMVWKNPLQTTVCVMVKRGFGWARHVWCGRDCGEMGEGKRRGRGGN